MQRSRTADCVPTDASTAISKADLLDQVLTYEAELDAILEVLASNKRYAEKVKMIREILNE